MASASVSTPRPIGSWLGGIAISLWLFGSVLLLGGAEARVMQVLVSLGVGVGLGALLTRAGPRCHPVVTLGLLPLLGWMVTNAFFVTPAPWVGSREVLLWIQAWIAFAWSSSYADRSWSGRLPGWSVVVSVLIACAIAMWQHWVQPGWLMQGKVQVAQYLGRSSGSFGNPNQFAALLVLLLPVALAFGRASEGAPWKRVGWIYVMAMFGVGLVLSFSRGGWLALVAVAALACGWEQRRRVWLGYLGVGVLVLALSVPGMRDRILALQTTGGEPARALLWRSTWTLSGEHPWFGWGAGSFATAFETVRPRGFRDEPGWAHQEYLNAFLEYGTLGVLLLGGYAFLLWRARGKPRAGTGWESTEATRALGLGLAGVSVACLFDFHWRVPGVLLPTAWAAGVLVRRRWSTEEHSAKKKWPALVLAAVSGVAALWGFRVYGGEALRDSARSHLDTAVREFPSASPGFSAALERARLELAKAAERDPSNAAVWSDRAYVELLAAESSSSGTAAISGAAESYAREAVKLGKRTYEPWMRLGQSLHFQGRWQEAGEAFGKALECAPAKAVLWYHYARFLAQKNSTRRLAKVAVESCLQLDPTFVPAQALRSQLSSVE